MNFNVGARGIINVRREQVTFELQPLFKAGYNNMRGIRSNDTLCEYIRYLILATLDLLKLYNFQGMLLQYEL